MALYKTHAKFNTFFALPLLIWAGVYFLKPTYINLAIFALTFVYATFFMNPDLDIANKIKLFSIRGILTLPFRFYSYVFRHRGISHIFILGTITRVLWLGGFLLLILYFFDKPIPSKNTLQSLFHNELFLFGLSGIIIADFCHLILDFKLRK